MIQQEFRKQLKSALQNVKIHTRQEHLEHTKVLAKNETYRNIGRDRISFIKFLSIQIKFIGWRIWLLQGVTFMGIIFFLTVSMGKYFLENPRYVAMLLCSLSVLILMTTIPFIHRSFYYKMHEIEASTCFSSVKLLMAELLIIGIGDVFTLACILCFAVLKTPLSMGSAILYLMFPFLLTSCSLLYILAHIPAKRVVVGSIGVCFFLFIVFLLLANMIPSFYLQTFSVKWSAVCLMLILICALQFRQIIYRCSYTEMQLV